MKFIRQYSNIIFLVLIFLEGVFMLLTYRRVWGQTPNAIIYFISSLLIGLLLLVKFFKADVTLVTTPQPKRNNFIVLAISLILLLVTGTLLASIFKEYPIDVKKSDIIPSIQVMVNRLLHGQYAYAPIYDFGYLFSPTYLPMQWLPYVAAEKSGLDYRWISFAIWGIGYLLIVFRSLKSDNLLLKISIPLLLFGISYAIDLKEPNLPRYTVESMVAGYYMLLITSLNSRNAFFIGICITLCLLSRFSLLLWLPLAAFVLVVSGYRQLVFKVIGVVAFLVAVLYIIPFLSKDWHSFQNGYEHYDRATLGEWQDNLNDDHMPNQLYAGTGFAHLFYESHTDWQIADKIKQLKKVHVLLSTGICFIMGTWYWRNRKNIDNRIFLMASFKIYLAFFLAFIQVPYVYLMTVASFVSIAMFAEQFSYKLIRADT